MSTTTFQLEEIFRLRAALTNEINSHEKTKSISREITRNLDFTRTLAFKNFENQVQAQAQEIKKMKTDAADQAELLKQSQAETETLRTQVETQAQEMEEMKVDATYHAAQLKQSQAQTACRMKEAGELRTQLVSEEREILKMKDKAAHQAELLKQSKAQTASRTTETVELFNKLVTQSDDIQKMRSDAALQAELLEQSETKTEILRTRVRTQAREMEDMKTQLATKTDSFVDGFHRFDKELKEAQAQIESAQALVQSQARDLKNAKAQLLVAQAETQAQRALVAQTLSRAEKAEQAVEVQAQKFESERTEHKSKLEKMNATREEALERCLEAREAMNAQTQLIETAGDEILKLNNQTAQYAEALALFEEGQAQAKAALAQTDAARAQTDAARAQTKTAQAQVREARAIAGSAQAVSLEALALRAQAEEKAQVLEQKLAEAEEDLKDVGQAHAQALEKARILDAHIQMAHARSWEILAEKDSAEKKAKGLERKLAEAQAQKAQAEEKVQALELKLAEADAKLEALEAQKVEEAQSQAQLAHAPEQYRHVDPWKSRGRTTDQSKKEFMKAFFRH